MINDHLYNQFKQVAFDNELKKIAVSLNRFTDAGKAMSKRIKQYNVKEQIKKYDVKEQIKKYDLDRNVKRYAIPTALAIGGVAAAAIGGTNFAMKKYDKSKSV